ncbi:transient receptor potential cation channel subfamily V member 1-like [Magallana gigas]|uniref:transient receptor potential cation channel subfamily V member 1-like n=1 Tax=Magallana gigas TaxID=29159 RepID=UPI0033413207
MEKRGKETKYKGQTLLHVAIVKGNIKAVEIILKTANEDKFSKKLLKTCAVCNKFKNTVLIGQLPFSVAALACRNKDFQIIKYLLTEVDVWKRNRDGDNVFHSLIKYADIYPEKMQHIRPTFEYIWSEVFQDYICESQRAFKNPVDSYFWKKMENSSGLTPLHLSAKLGVTYFIFAVWCILRLVRRCTAEKGFNIGLMWHNLDYIICLLFIAIGVLMESILIYLEIHWDYHLVLALIGGWYFLLYFTPFNKSLVSFTYMIKSGVFEDFLPFALVFLFLLTSFTAIMDMLYRGTGVEEFKTFGNSFLTMFNLGVGLNDIGILNKSRIPWLAYTLFVIYVILSFIHLFNALVAVMSQTFSGVHQDRNAYQKYYKLRMIELFEDIFLVKIGTEKLLFLNWAKHWIQEDKREGEENSITNNDNEKTKNDDDKEDSKKNKEHISKRGNKITQKSSGEEDERNDNDSNDSNEQNNGRFYSILQLLDDLDDYRDDIEEKKRNLTEYLRSRIRKKENTAGLKKYNKTNPEGDVTFIQLQSKSSQYPESH